MTETVEQQKKVRQSGGSRAYRSPKLRLFGGLRELTAGGSGDAQEHGEGKEKRP